jgi:hypothetical protein
VFMKYAEVTFFPRNFPLFNSAEFRAISCTEFCIRNLSDKLIQEPLDFFVLRTEVKLKTSISHFFYSYDSFGNNLLYLFIG